MPATLSPHLFLIPYLAITGVTGVLSGSIYRTYSAPQVLLGVEVDMFFITFVIL
jgi:hypothetical protein